MIKFKNKYTQLNWNNLNYMLNKVKEAPNKVDGDYNGYWSKIAYESDKGFYKKQWQDNYLLLLATMPPKIKKILEDSSVNIGPILEEEA